MNFYKRQFTDAQVDKLKRITAQKNALHNYNNLAEDYDTRWVGIAGELTYRQYLDKAGFVYEHHYNPNKIDVVDFTIGKEKIEIKTLARSFDPQPHYACDVNAKQMEKMDKARVATDFVFASYNLKTNVCALLGKIEYGLFLLLSELKYKGTILENGRPAPNDLYDLHISDLEPLEYVDDFLVDNWLVV